jgi:hypothetical protein
MELCLILVDCPPDQGHTNLTRLPSQDVYLLMLYINKIDTHRISTIDGPTRRPRASYAKADLQLQPLLNLCENAFYPITGIIPTIRYTVLTVFYYYYQ